MEQLYHDIAFRTSAMITKSYSTSFSIAVRMLSPEQRLAVYSIYGFVRLADEIVDTFHDNKQQEILDNFERDLDEAFKHGMSMNPVLHAFVSTVNKYNIAKKHIDSFMKSMRTDLFKQDYKSDEETMEYVYGSAEVVGLMCLKIFVDGDENHYNELERPAKKLGSAFQKVNFLRDLKADKEKLERSYFADITHGTLDEDVKSSLIEEIDQEFLEARKGIDKLPGRSRFAVLVAYLYYRQLLRKLKRTPAHMIMNKRIRVNNSRKLILLFNAYITYKSKSA